MVSILPRSEANDVFRLLEQEGVRIALDDSCRAQSVDAIESLLKKYKESGRHFIIDIIVSTAQKELLKSREIDVNIIKHVVGFMLDKISRARRVRLASLKKLVEEGEGEGEEEEDDDDEEEDEEDEDEDEEDEDEDEEEDANDCIVEMLKCCSEMGCSLKKGQERQMVDQIIPYRRIYKYGTLSQAIAFLMNKVREHILKSCILDHVGPVHCGLESQKLGRFELFKKEPTVSVRKLLLDFFAPEEDEAEADGKDQVHQQLMKNIVSTKEEGIATPKNQLKQEEKRECGVMELEECEIVAPLNLPDQGENMVKANFCLTQPEREDMETEECGIAKRGGANKRSLAQLELGY